MSNELKFGNKVVFLGGNPLTLPVATSDPGSPVAGDMYYNSTSNTIRYHNGTSWAPISSGGSVTSVAVQDGGGSIFSISGSPITTSGTISLNLATQTANTVLAGPTTGSPAAPTFRSLVAGDIPSLSYANQTLSNLGTTSINAALTPDTDAGRDLGTTSKKWGTIYVGTVAYPSGASIDMSTSALVDSAAATKLTWDTTGIKFDALTATTVPYLNASKYLVSHTSLQAAALTNSITLLSLPAKTMIQQVIVKHSTAFAGTGITGYTTSVGISGNNSKYTAAFNVFQSTSDTARSITQANDLESFSGSTNITITATSTGANLNQSTSGSVDIWVQTSLLP